MPSPHFLSFLKEESLTRQLVVSFPLALALQKTDNLFVELSVFLKHKHALDSFPRTRDETGIELSLSPF